MAIVFLDTNILVYLSSPQSPFHTVANQRVRELQGNGDTLSSSGQVLREFMVVMTRAQHDSAASLLSEVVSAERSYRSTLLIPLETKESIQHVARLIQQYQLRGKVIHDANLVGIMLDNGITRILTHNVNDFERFQIEGVEVLPLLTN